jgi:hypothetical protein
MRIELWREGFAAGYRFARAEHCPARRRVLADPAFDPPSRPACATRSGAFAPKFRPAAPTNRRTVSPAGAGFFGFDPARV